MPTLRPRKRASASSSRSPSSWPATTTVPESGRSRPAITISRVDFPDPDGPTMPTASPRPILRPMSLRICTRAAPRPSDRLTPASAIAGVARCRPEVSFMRWFRRLLAGAADLKLLRRVRQILLGASNRKAAPDHRVASALLFSKLVSEGAARDHELRKRGSDGGGSRSYGVRPALVQSVILVAALGVFLTLIPPAGAADGPVKLVALGDSLTAGFNLPASAAFPARLERALRAKGHAVEIANAGVSGDTASGGLARLDWSVPDGTAAVIVELGANDMLRGIDPKVTQRALEEIVRRLSERRIAVLLAGMRAIPNLGVDFANGFETIYPAIASKYDALLYPFFLDGVAGDPRLKLADGLHPTAAGIDIIVARILPKAEELVTRAKAMRP